MAQSAYSTLKAAWHLDRIEALRAGRNIAPVELQLIMSDLCNHDCHFCAYRASNGLSTERFVEIGKDGERNHNPARLIPVQKIKEILKDAADLGIKSIIFTGGGEPTVHPHHMECFKYALDLGLQCSLNTNGVRFVKGWEEVLPYFTYVRFSIDAGNAEEYAKVRGCKETHYEFALNNLKALSDEVKAKKTECIVGAGYVVTPGNHTNVYEGVRNIKDAGAAYVRLAAMQSTEGRAAYGGSWLDARNNAKYAQVHADDDFAVYDLMEGVIGERPDYQFCGFQHFVMYVGANLECYRCCYTAYTDHGHVGDLKDQTLAEYVKGRDLWGFDATSCAVCPLNEKNKVIDYMTQDNPTHINFV